MRGKSAQLQEVTHTLMRKRLLRSWPELHRLGAWYFCTDFRDSQCCMWGATGHKTGIKEELAVAFCLVGVRSNPRYTVSPTTFLTRFSVPLILNSRNREG